VDLTYNGKTIDTTKDIPSQLTWLDAASRYVIKVDQGVKGRYKKGLVKLDVPYDELPAEIVALQAKGYRWLIIEPHVVHAAAEERYLQLSRDRNGIHILHSERGGVNVEDNPEDVQSHTLSAQTNWADLAQKTGVHEPWLRKLVDVFIREYMTFLEINPFVKIGNIVHFLDVAAEVDDAGAYFAKGWSQSDFRAATSHPLTQQERAIQLLDEKSPASFSFTLLNPNGSIFLLLSGGGASVVVADEVYATKHGHQLANYGEYSGNPTADETRDYTTAVLQSLLASNAPKKVLFIGGAVANFTDIVNTFSGIIGAIESLADQLQQQDVKVYARRGGPRQEQGLAALTLTLQKHNLLGAVHGPEVPLIAAIDEALEVTA
jgi:ATP-citrate lyase beta-subunit